MHDGRNAVAMLHCDEILIYDGKGGYGPYLHAHGATAWAPWSSTERRLSAWLWIGSGDNLLQSIQQAAERLPAPADVTVTVGQVQARLEQAPRTGKTGWRRPTSSPAAIGCRRTFGKSGPLSRVARRRRGQLPEQLHTVSAGDLGLLLERTDSGIRRCSCWMPRPASNCWLPGLCRCSR